MPKFTLLLPLASLKCVGDLQTLSVSPALSLLLVCSGPDLAVRWLCVCGISFLLCKDMQH